MLLLEAEKWSLFLWCWMVLAYLLSDRVNTHLCCPSPCPTAIPHLHMLKEWCLQNIQKRWRLCLPKSQLQNINSGCYFSITGLQWLLGQTVQMMVGISWTVIMWCSRELLSWEVMGRTSETGFRDQVSRLQSGGQKKQVVCYPIPISRAMWPSQVTFLPLAVFFKEARDNNRINFIELWELLGKITTYQYTMNMWQRFYVTY